MAVNADNLGNMRRFLTLDHMAISKRHKGMVINYRVAVSNFELTDHKAVSMTISLPWMRNYLVNKGPMWNIGPGRHGSTSPVCVNGDFDLAGGRAENVVTSWDPMDISYTSRHHFCNFE